VAKSRHDLLVNGAIASLGVAGAVGLQALLPKRNEAADPMDKQNDVKVLNGALFYEHQAIWAYKVGKSRSFRS